MGSDTEALRALRAAERIFDVFMPPGVREFIPPEMRRESVNRIAAIIDEETRCGKLREACKECLDVVDDCYRATGHTNVSAGSHQRQRITAALAERSTT